MAPLSNEETMKLLYGVIKLTNAKPSMGALGKFMGLKPGTASWRYQTAIAKLVKEHGEIDVDGIPSATVASGGGPTGKRKRTTDKEEGPKKRAKGNGPEEGEIADKDHQSKYNS